MTTRKLLTIIIATIAVLAIVASVIAFPRIAREREIQAQAGKLFVYQTDNFLYGECNVRTEPFGDIAYTMQEGDTVTLTGKSHQCLDPWDNCWVETTDGYWISYRLLTPV